MTRRVIANPRTKDNLCPVRGHFQNNQSRLRRIMAAPFPTN